MWLLLAAGSLVAGCGAETGADAPAEGSDEGSEVGFGTGAFELVSRSTEGPLTASLINTPPDVGAAIVQTDNGTVVIPGTANLYFCDTIERFCDNRAVVPMPMDTSELGLPTAALVDDGSLYVAHERGIVRLPPRLDEVEVLLRFSELEANPVRNVTSLQMMTHAEGSRFLLASGFDSFRAREVTDGESFYMAEPEVVREHFGAPLLLLSLDDPDGVGVQEWGLETSFDSHAISPTEVVVGDDFGFDLMCRLVSGRLDCAPQDGNATMALVPVPSHSPVVEVAAGTRDGRVFLLAAYFDYFTLVVVEATGGTFRHVPVPTEMADGTDTARTVYWGAALDESGTTLIASSGSVREFFDTLFSYPTPPCATSFAWSDAPGAGARFGITGRICLPKRADDGTTVYAARDVLPLGDNRFVGWPHLSAFLPGGSRHAWTYVIAPAP